MPEEKTAAQNEQSETDYARGAAASARFRRVYPEFDAYKPENVELMKKLVKDDGGEWSYELLVKLFEAHRSEFKLRTQDATEEAAPALVVEETPKPEWWSAVEDKDTIDAISRSDFRRWIKDPEFVRVVERVANGGSRE